MMKQLTVCKLLLLFFICQCLVIGAEPWGAHDTSFGGAGALFHYVLWWELHCVKSVDSEIKCLVIILICHCVWALEKNHLTSVGLNLFYLWKNPPADSYSLNAKNCISHRKCYTRVSYSVLRVGVLEVTFELALEDVV